MVSGNINNSIVLSVAKKALPKNGKCFLFFKCGLMSENGGKTGMIYNFNLCYHFYTFLLRLIIEAQLIINQSKEL